MVTNALNIAAELALRPRLKLIMTGGVSRTQSYELVGPIADQALAGLNIEVAVVGVDGISARGGLTTHDEIEAQHQRDDDPPGRPGDRGRRRVQGRARSAWPRICPITDVDELVTDASADPTRARGDRGGRRESHDRNAVAAGLKRTSRNAHLLPRTRRSAVRTGKSLTRRLAGDG